MISRYKEVDVDDASPGMVLARAVLDPRGAVLLPQGATLTEQALTSLRRRGVDAVRVEDAEVDPAQLAAERARIEQRLAHLYRRGAAGRADAELRELLRGYRLEALQ
jgi:hypothetical protein